MPGLRIPRPSLRLRRARNAAPSNTATTVGPGVRIGAARAWPLPGALWRGPQLLWRGPRALLRAPKAVLRAGRSQRLFSTSTRLPRQQIQNDVPPKQEEPQAGPSTAKQEEQQHSNESFTSRLRKRLRDTPIKWYPIPASLGAAVLVAVSFYKQRAWEQFPESDEKGKQPVREEHIKVKGPWQVHVIGALPLRTISRIYGQFNSYTLPVWFRVPGYKLYAFIFGVNLEECDPGDLREYRSMSEFFMRKLKPGVRPVDVSQLVSPADGKVVNIGVVEGGRVEQVKGSTYSLEALLSGTGHIKDLPSQTLDYRDDDMQKVDEKEFANINDIKYSLGDLLGPEGQAKQEDASMSQKEQNAQEDGPRRSVAGDASVALEVAPSAAAWASGKVPQEGNKLFFAVVYLAPGDYHRFHSPAAWVVERRRHFAGELFSVSPWMANKLQDLFVLNERVALLGRWRHGFFSMVPVGATNVGSIRVNFDSDLRTNSPLRPVTPGTYSEAVYHKASALLGGQPLHKGDEVGGFWLGSTIVLVFEAPNEFKFDVKIGQRVKMGEKLGDC